MRHYQKWFVILIVILATAGGCGGSASPSRERTGIENEAGESAPKFRRKFHNSSPRRTPITIASFNINWGNRDVRATADIIVSANADVVCIQESTPEFERYARSHLRARYPKMLFRGDGDRFPAERFGYLAAHPFRKESFLPAKHGIFGAWIVEVDVAGETLQIANVHLDPIQPTEDDVLGPIKAFSEAEQIHDAEIRWIFEHLSPTLPTVIAGDFNSLSAGAAPAYLVKKGFVDSFAATSESPDSNPTWRWPTRFLDLAARIDYIFHSPHFKTTESRIADQTTSDHSLVVSRLEWANEDGDQNHAPDGDDSP